MGFAERICVIGCSGSGKSTFADRCARELGHARLELDAVYHQRGWVPRPDDEARAEVRTFVDEHPRWVVDGNYSRYRDILWAAADTVVWLDVDRPTVMRQVVTRTVRRLVRREVLWNGNRESWGHVFSRDPKDSIVMWSWTQHAVYREMYLDALRSDAYPHLRWLRLRDRCDVSVLFERARRRGGIAPDDDPAQAR